MADGKLNEQEIRFLDLWLKENKDIAAVWPGDVITRRVRDVLADDIVTDDELEHLQATLKELIGGTLQDTGAISGLSTSLPINDDLASPVVFKESSFCFTGNFLFGTRAACERAITQRGAVAWRVIGRVIGDVPRYFLE